MESLVGYGSDDESGENVQDTKVGFEKYAFLCGVCASSYIKKEIKRLYYLLYRDEIEVSSSRLRAFLGRCQVNCMMDAIFSYCNILLIRSKGFLFLISFFSVTISASEGRPR
jgi:hypothetical protein